MINLEAFSRLCASVLSKTSKLLFILKIKKHQKRDILVDNAARLLDLSNCGSKIYSSSTLLRSKHLLDTIICSENGTL
jgi:hypothetical protein